MIAPRITKIEIESFTWDIVGLRHGRAFHYDPDSTLTRHASGIRIYADNGAVAEFHKESHVDARATSDVGTRPVALDSHHAERCICAARRTTLTFNDGGGMAFNRGASQAPFNADIALSIHVIDEDNIAHAANPVSFGAPTAGNGMAFDSGKAMRWGRVALTNTAGSDVPRSR